MAFENLNSLETLNIQNNKLTRIPEEVMVNKYFSALLPLICDVY